MSSIDPKSSRGYRNRNPGNIEHHEHNRWLGLADPPTDGRFCRFTEHRYGIRALALLLMAYYDRHGCDTVAKIIERWAPTHENPTRSYAVAVAQRLGVRRDDRIDVHAPHIMHGLVAGIIRFELGGQPYSEPELWDGLELAGFRRPKPAGIAEAATTDTGKGTIAATVAGAAAVASQAEPVIDALGRLPWQAAIAVVLVAAIAVLVWRARRS
ncbi:structural protein [Elioraea sp.]|uniref:structural protein n=1 Tax=Elioraea sp. TaxID=2185103 RepID=UPI003F714D4E